MVTVDLPLPEVPQIMMFEAYGSIATSGRPIVGVPWPGVALAVPAWVSCSAIVPSAIV